MLYDNGEEIVSNMIGGEVDALLNKLVSKLLEGHEDHWSKLYIGFGDDNPGPFLRSGAYRD